MESIGPQVRANDKVRDQRAYNQAGKQKHRFKCQVWQGPTLRRVKRCGQLAASQLPRGEGSGDWSGPTEFGPEGCVEISQFTRI